MKLKTCLLISAMLALNLGCVKASECAWTEYIYLTENDAVVISDGLANDIIGHNESREENCR